MLATISTPENLARIESIRTAQRRLADPRGLAPEDEARFRPLSQQTALGRPEGTLRNLVANVK